MVVEHAAMVRGMLVAMLLQIDEYVGHQGDHAEVQEAAV